MLCSKTEEGLRYAVLREGRKVACCAFSVRCGTREEGVTGTGVKNGGRFHSGTAHFVEHMLFKGTERRSAAVINGYLEKLGGELNAYTTKEEIVLHATVLKEDMAKAAGLLFELAARSTFPEKEIEKEKTVVIDEIASYRDSPADDIYDNFESLLFEGHPLCGNVLGTPSSVKKITGAELKDFVGTFFVPERAAFTLVSPLPEEEAAKLVAKLSAKYFGDFSGGRNVYFSGGCSAGISGELPGEDAPKIFPGNLFSKTVNRHSHQANCIIGATAPPLGEEKKRIAAALMANILGGPAANSVLNSRLREKKGWVYNVECNYSQYADSGVMAICFGCDREHLEGCIAVIKEEIRRLQNTPLTERSLKAAKKQLEGQMAIASENSESQALSMGKSLLAFSCVRDDGYVREAVSSVTAEEIRQAASEIFRSDRLSTLIYL